MKTFSKVAKNPNGKTRRFAALAGLAVVLVIAGSMVAGILLNSGNGKLNSESYNANDVVSENSRESIMPQPTVAAGAPAGSVANQAPKGSGTTTSNNGTGSSTYNMGSVSDRMIIRNATLSLEAENMEKTLADIRALVSQQQGTVFSSNTTIRNEQTYATVVIQVPSVAYDETMSRLRGLAYKVVSESSSSQDVTEEFVDTEAQIRNLKATEAQLLDLLKKATNVNETLTVQRELTNVRSEIERRQGRLNLLQKKSDFSTITLNIAPKGVLSGAITPKNVQTWDFGRMLENAWEGSLRGLQGLATVTAVLVVYGIWVVPLLALAFFFARYAFRRFFRATPPVAPAAVPQQPQSN